MKILHYISGIPPVRGGGMIRYALDLVRQESLMGEDVQLLIPGVLPGNTTKKVKICRYGKYKQIPVSAIYNPLPVPMGNGILDIDTYTRNCNGKVYTDFLQKIKPDTPLRITFMGKRTWI